MNKEHILEHLSYHYWATGKLLDCCEQLDSLSLNQNVGGSFGSMFATLIHMYSAETVWLARWQEQPEPAFAAPNAFEDVRALRNAWQLKGEDIIAFARTADSSKVMNIRSHQHALWEMILHMIDHSSFHRGQVIFMLRNAGQTPPQTNFIHYLREQA
jgi:uncharacterized damage-inducible protein DinB